MKRPSFIPQKDWDIVETYCSKYGVDPYLVAAIGWHETHWGKLGWGKKGYYLGVGCYSKTNANPAFQGLTKQLEWAVPHIADFMAGKLNLPLLILFAKQVWRPGNPEGWANSVFQIWKALREKYAGGVPKPVQLPPDYIPVRDYLEPQGYEVGWNDTEKKVTANGVSLDIEGLEIQDGKSYATADAIEKALVDAGLKKAGEKSFFDKLKEYFEELIQKALAPITKSIDELKTAFEKFTDRKSFTDFITGIISEEFEKNTDFWFGLFLKLLDKYYDRHKGEK